MGFRYIFVYFKNFCLFVFLLRYFFENEKTKMAESQVALAWVTPYATSQYVTSPYSISNKLELRICNIVDEVKANIGHQCGPVGR